MTGVRIDLPAGLIDRVRWLRTKTDVPILVGFGISAADQVKAVCEVADGAIVGSALVRLVAEQAAAGPAALSAAVEKFMGELAVAAGK